MAPFKKNKKTPAIWNTLNKNLTEAKAANRNYFYCPLLEGEEKQAQIWANAHKFVMTLNYINGNTFIYMFRKLGRNNL